MESLEARAKTVEEAIQQAISQLGVSREEVEVDVISEGKSGILGLGSDEAVVRVTPITFTPDEDISEYVQNTIDNLLGLLGVDGSAVLQPPPAVEGQQHVRHLGQSAADHQVPREHPERYGVRCVSQ